MPFQENFTYFHQSFEDHYKYVSCDVVMTLPHDQRCEFVRTMPNCKTMPSFINYLELTFCSVGAVSFEMQLLLGLLGLTLCMYFALWIHLISDNFFTPSLKSIARKLNMDEHTTGVTLLAAGNSATTIFFSYNINSTTQLFTGSLATGLFTMLVSGGLTCLFFPTKLNEYNTICDNLFFVMMLMVMEYILIYNSPVTFGMALGIISIYVIFVSVNVIDIILSNLQEKIFLPLFKKKIVTRVMPRGAFMKAIRSFDIYTFESVHHESYDPEETRLKRYKEVNKRNKFIYKDFITNLKPLRYSEFKRARSIQKAYLCLKAPLLIINKLLIPSVNLEEDKHAWSKLLNLVQIVAVPMLFCKVMLGRANLILYVSMITVPLALFILFHSRTDVPPSYHFGFMILCAISSISLMYFCEREIAAITKIVSMGMSLSDYFSSITIKCWGMEMSMLITNINMARHGYQAVAFAAGVGGAFHDLTLANGVILAFRAYNGEPMTADSGYMEGAFLFMFVAIFANLFWVSTFNFHTRRSFGISSILTYIIFLGFSFLEEIGYIHPLTKDIRQDII